MFGKQFKIVFSLCFKKLIQLLKEPNTSTRLFDVVLHQNINWVIIAQFYKNMYYHRHHHHYRYPPQPCCSTPFTLMLTRSDTLHDSSNICNMRTSDHLIRFLRLCLSSDNAIRYWAGVRGQKGIPQLWSNFKFYCILNKTKAFISRLYQCNWTSFPHSFVVPIHTPEWRGDFVRVKCLAQEHKKMT